MSSPQLPLPYPIRYTPLCPPSTPRPRLYARLQALAAGLPIVYNNAYDTRRTVRIECSDVMALQANHISISTLQVNVDARTSEEAGDGEGGPEAARASEGGAAGG